MTFEEMIQRPSPYLLCWIDLAMTLKHLTDISQLRRIKPKLKNLYWLDLRATSFTDCFLLSGLTQLKSLALPARKKLIHTEVLDTFSWLGGSHVQYLE